MTRRLFALLAGLVATPQPPAFFREHEGNAMGVPDGQTAVFRLSFAPVSHMRLDVFLNGLFQREGPTYDYTFSGRTVTFNRPPSAGDFVTVQYYTS